LMLVAYLALFGWLSIEQVRTDIEKAQSKRRKTRSANITIEDL